MPAAQVTPLASTASSPAGAVTVERKQDVSLGSAGQSTVWDLKLNGVSTLKVQLIAVTERGREVLDKTECSWSPAAPTGTSAHLHFLLESGEPFGQKGKSQPLLWLSFDGAAPQSKVDSRASGAQPFPAQQVMAHSISGSSDMGRGQTQLLFDGIYGPPVMGNTTLSTGGLDSLPEQAKGGRTVLAITLDWS